ncbi:WD40 repeat domain-containing protein [Cyanobacterium stanieri LEGE 03274]|uniref:WD40 repeat domain-containing protein n=1 Tax=Cyanobacterium stanieri LEGE 03274 TaxID=1828756 RepID=A0ABR9V2S7_9CHRO|nr:WD40 repeat domain-containing protein [Cyanobacterium stanieri]MBE9222185.1 WD40 repeat domain-containing protein [Cyanobacterium stanieri LEGE 03274]
MIFKSLTWWEIGEYITTFVLLILLLVNNPWSDNFWVVFVVAIVLILNIINRKSLEYRNKQRIAAALNIQLKKFSEKLLEVNSRIDILINNNSLNQRTLSSGKMGLSENEIIACLQKDVESINQSVSSMIDYINGNNLLDRISVIEQKLPYIDSSNYSNSSDNDDTIKLPKPEIIKQKLPEYNYDSPPKIAWKCIHVIEAHNQSVTDMSITMDKQYLVSVSWDQYLKLWSLEDGLEIDAIQGSEQGLVTVATHLNNYLDHGIATGSLDQDVKIWSLEKKGKKSLKFKLEHILSEHTGSIHGLEIAPENNFLISGSYDQTLKKWDLIEGTLIDTCYDDSGAINAIALNDEIGIMVSGGGDGTISVWEINSNRKLALLVDNLISLESISISASGEYVAAGCANGDIKIWYLPPSIFTLFQEVSPTLQLQGHHGQIMDIAFHPDDQLLYTVGVDGFLKIWYCATGKELGHLKISEDNRIFSLTLSHDGEILAAGGIDGIIKIWQQTKTTIN